MGCSQQVLLHHLLPGEGLSQCFNHLAAHSEHKDPSGGPCPRALTLTLTPQGPLAPGIVSVLFRFECLIPPQQEGTPCSGSRCPFPLQVSLNDSHNQMVVHWAGEKSNVIVALARDSLSLLGPKNSDVSAVSCLSPAWHPAALLL